MRVLRYAVFAIGLLSAAPVAAQNATPCSRIDLTSSLLSDARRSLWRALTITQLPDNSGFFRSRSEGMSVCADSVAFLQSWGLAAPRHAWEILPVEAAVRTNSAYPRTENDGAAWLGKGANFGVTAGARGQWKFLRASVAPEFYYAQNQDFNYVINAYTTLSRFANPYHSDIDFPTRFGDAAYSTFVPGQSYLQATNDKFSATIGTENVWVGAAHEYPLLISYTAPGFPHLRIGTQRALQIPLAKIEFQVLFASLKESKYFDNRTDNNNHYFTTALLVVQPNFLPGLSLGVARALHDSASAKGQGIGFFTSRIIDNPFGGSHSGNRTAGNGLGVVLVRWVLPESKFEAYGEWGKEDTPGGFLDLLREPDWTQAYVIGFQKAYVRHGQLQRFYGEMVHLGESPPARDGRGFFSWYTHSVITQGHTNEGQLLGAAIGPGSDAQFVGADFYDARSRTGVRVQRTRYDDDTYYRTFGRRWGETRHDAEITLSATRTQFFGPLEAEAGLALSRRYGRQFIPLPSAGPDLVENNVSLHLGAAWHPSF